MYRDHITAAKKAYLKNDQRLYRIIAEALPKIAVCNRYQTEVQRTGNTEYVICTNLINFSLV